jgi:D-tyrosyl-tRNA(Tyr) deacylase
MRAVVQRVSRAEVRLDGRAVARIDGGLVVLLGIRHDDTDAEACWLAAKVAGLRLFAGAGGKFDRSLADVDGAILVVSQFTVYGDARKGRRPDFAAAAGPEPARQLYEAFAEHLRSLGHRVATGVFGAMMEVELVNDGPVTLVVDRDVRRSGLRAEPVGRTGPTPLES